MSYIVYKHVNRKNGKIYIGITSQSVISRWKNGNGYNHNLHFVRAIEKYGWDCFDHVIVAENLSKEKACELEKFLIHKYNTTDTSCGYNKTLGGEGGGMYKKRQSEIAKKKISEARKRIGFSEMHKKHISAAKSGAKHHFAKKVYQFTTDMKFVKEWEYVTLASNELHINKANICEVCHGNRKSAGGFVWKYQKG